MRRPYLLAIAAVLAVVFPAPAVAMSPAGGAGYGDPPGWCTRFSDMWPATVVTNDPLVGTNPEKNTFSGFHPNPGYDDWYGYFYGDFRGTPGDASGWVKLLHETYPKQYSWNFATNGWAVHGHAKQYIAYYNWTFGGQCGMGRYGNLAPAPYMADQIGWPVVNIYVDSVAPFPPAPRVVAATPTSIAFAWDAVADRGDGAGRDYFEAGVDHYNSWITVDGGPPQQVASTIAPRAITAVVRPQQSVCVHVEAVDRVGNATPDETACGTAFGAPPMPAWPPLKTAVFANPAPVGLVGLESWLWIEPRPQVIEATGTYAGMDYRIVATPIGADWDFGDGHDARLDGGASFGAAFPARSSVTHTYEAHNRSGYVVSVRVRYSVTWSALVGRSWVGPYPMGTMTEPAQSLPYSVEQAQPELVRLGP
jgi:hypothetical protein